MKDLSRGGRLWLVGYLVLAAVDLVAEAFALGMLKSAMLLLLMVALAGFHVQVNQHVRTRLYWFVAGALVLSWLGDNAGGIALLAKILFFLVVQALYIAAFWPRREHSVLHRRPVLVVPYALVAVALVVLVAPDAGALLVPVIIYALAMVAMAVLSTGLNRWTTIGGILFLVSDAVLGLMLLTGGRFDFPLDGVVVMATYLAAQLLLVWGIKVHADDTLPPARVERSRQPAGTRRAA